MSRIPLIATKDHLDPGARAAYDAIAESRGEVSRPFQLLLHTPRMAERVAELGHVLRFGSGLSDADRELVTLATGRAIRCSFVWESHVRHAEAAGIRPETIASLEGDRRDLDEREEALVAFVHELCETGAVTDPTFAAVHRSLGTPGLVELALTIAYYTMLASVMSACDAC